MTEAESIINCRPLTVEDISDPLAGEPITPNHLLTLKTQIVLPPPGNFEPPDLYSRKRWRRVQFLANQFWLRWQKEYCSQLQKRQKWQHPKRNMAAGDVVLVYNQEAPRSQWPLAVVTKTLPSKDGAVRKVEIQTCKNGEKKFFQRPIHKDNKQTNKPASLKATKPASLQATKPASLQATKPASLQATKPASLQATKPASLQATKPASLQATKPASLQATKPASLQATKPASLQATKPASLQATKPASLQATKPASLQATKPASLQATKPASLQATKPASLQATKPASLQATKPASLQATKPASKPLNQPACKPLNQPASI
ncbi:hypothetical protein QZH41_004010 [Actinostola sp. cb2023]|nr:hypothetical protein QZH41_004010 [Actinostola sp. cb2023]